MNGIAGANATLQAPVNLVTPMLLKSNGRPHPLKYYFEYHVSRPSLMYLAQNQHRPPALTSRTACAQCADPV
eukprot:5400105-Amphidinium_carterae.2